MKKAVLYTILFGLGVVLLALLFEVLAIQADKESQWRQDRLESYLYHE